MKNLDHLLGHDDLTILDELGARTGGRDPLRLKTGIAKALSESKSKRVHGSAPVNVVTNSSEFQRILALPRRVLDFGAVTNVTEIFRKEGGTMVLRSCQSAGLIDAALANGLFAQVAAGFGKTLISLLLPTALDSEHAVLFVPTSIYPQLQREIKTVYGPAFELPLDRLTILTYEQLSSPKNADLLEEIHKKRPIDLFICDEAHRLRHKTSARTKRYFRFAKDHPSVRHCHLSGTMATRSIREYSHLIELCLRKMSPVPRGYNEVLLWAGALDAKPEVPSKPGVLKQFCVGDETIRNGFRRRRNESQGVVATEENEVGVSLIINKLDLKVPDEVKTRLDDVRVRWAIDDNELEDITAKVRVLRQLACGFYYKWDWPDGEPDWEWLSARSAWNKAVRERLKTAPRGLDSPGLLAQAAERYYQGKREGKVWNAPEWEAWRLLKERPDPPIQTIWISRFLVEDAWKRAQKTEAPCVIWYEHDAVGQALGKISGLKVYGAGTDASPTRDRVLIASIHNQREGKNLQHHYAHNIFTSCAPNGTVMEQALARTHRPGQEYDEVYADIYGHTPEMRLAMDKALEDARFKEETGDGRQRLLYATKIGWD